MRHQRIRDVMTTNVAFVREGTTYKRIAQLLASRGVSGLPVLDAEDRVVGVVSEADLLYKEERRSEGFLPKALTGRRRRHALAKAEGDLAVDLMTSPAVTIDSAAYLTEAARLLVRHDFNRLPVVDEAGRLIGIVSRRDLLGVFLRSDEDIRAEVRDEVFGRAMMVDPATVRVAVRDGVVVLQGQLEQKSLISIAVRLTGKVDGVVDIIDRLTYAFDDTGISPTEPSLRGIMHGLPRR